MEWASCEVRARCIQCIALIGNKTARFSLISTDACSFKLPIDVPPNEPVYLLHNKNGYSLFEPDSQISTVNEKIVLLCPGKQNKLSEEHVSELTCNRKRVFNINPQSINCTKQVSGDLKVTQEKCAGNSGVIFHAGFRIDSEFVELYDICYNKQTASTIYTKHRLNGKAIKCKCLFWLNCVIAFDGLYASSMVYIQIHPVRALGA